MYTICRGVRQTMWEYLSEELKNKLNDYFHRMYSRYSRFNKDKSMDDYPSLNQLISVSDIRGYEVGDHYYPASDIFGETWCVDEKQRY